ncbi:MAG TPA: aminotransferase class III-fold pyridoxal phosphate-dependent enzyme, partial [Acidobacteriota bacterium]|nr:aminotransferase class III-fold pyridoxal phosphate-dependent enzyme [Acidobacteriota bacterium]
RHLGVPDAVRDLTHTFRYNDVDSLLNSADRDTAAIILEPVTFEAPKPGFLETLRAVADELGIVLIFDEMWTGFRISPGGAQQNFNVAADLACFSKAIANGMPLSVLTGKRDIMQLLERDVFFFTTFGGEALSLAAAKATIQEIADLAVPDHIARQNRKLRDGYNAIANQLGMGYTRCSGLDYRTLIQFDSGSANPLEMKSLVQQELIRRGVLWSGFHNLSNSHKDEDISDVLTAYRAVLPILRDAVEENRVREAICGTPVQPAFRITAGFDSKPLPQGSATLR